MYTSKNIEDELVSILQPHRKRNYLDKRNYLIGILSHKYNMTEEYIATITKLDRCTVHAAKNQASHLIRQNNEGFISAAAEYIEKFPHVFIEKTKSDRHKRLHTIVITLTDQAYKKLKKYKTIKEISTINVAGRSAIEKYLKLWDE